MPASFSSSMESLVIILLKGAAGALWLLLNLGIEGFSGSTE